MKFMFALIAFMAMASVADAQRVNLPDDSNKLTVTVFANSTAEASAFLNRHPEISRYRAGNHYNVYTQSNPMTKARFGDQTHMSAYVSTSNGRTVITAKDTSCILRKWRQNHCEPQKQEVDQSKIEQDEVPTDEPAPPVDEVNAWLLVGLAALGLAIGVGGSVYNEIKAK